MSYSNFDFLKGNYNELFQLAKNSEDLISTDPFAAMVNIQQMMRSVIHIIVGNTGLITNDLHMDGVIHSLWKNKLIEDNMYETLREIELFDSRESEIIIDLTRVEHIFIRMYDFTVWFYKTYVNDAFVPNSFVNPVLKEMNLLSKQQESKIELPVQLINIDGTVHKGEWVNGLKSLENYVINDYENGERYEGQIIKKSKHGRGIYTWLDGTVYIGYWSNDLEHGYGTKTTNGIKTRGFWNYGEFGYFADQLNDSRKK